MYLSKRGFVIKKDSLTTKELSLLKNKLRANPLCDDKFSFNTKDNSYPVYNETKNKIYIPKMFGVKEFGYPENVLDNYIGIEWKNEIEFKGNLRENQIEPCKLLLDACEKKGGGILSLTTGGGKCHKIDTKILMFDGFIKKVQDIKVGDLLMGDNSTPRTVLSLANGEDEMYDIISDKGDKYTVNQEHIMCLKVSEKPCIMFVKSTSLYIVTWVENLINKSKSFDKKEEGEEFLKNVKQDYIIEISVKDYIKLSKRQKHILKGYKVSIDFPEKELDFDPYSIGFWLNSDSSDVSLISDSTLTKSNSDLLFTNVLRNNNLIYNKHIPMIYKCNSRENRLKLLAGILDSDSENKQESMLDLENCFTFYFIQKSETLIDDTIYLCKSLGFTCYKNTCKKISLYKGVYKIRDCVKINILGNTFEIPILHKRKNNFVKNELVSCIKVKHVGRDNYYGFTLDKNCRYVMGDFTVTHNTFSALYVLSKLKSKTIIVVNKITLMNQWMHEINRFLPDAKIGTIQGQKNVNVTNCDIVVCMLQSISRIDYPEELFNDFGVCVIDECFVYNTNIITETGCISIGELYDKKNENLPLVKTFNELTKKFENKQILNVFRKINSKLIQITCYNNNCIISTKNHKYFTKDGWKEAINLTFNDFILTSNNYYTRVINKIFVENKCKDNYVYDLEIKDNHNYMVTDDNNIGLIVHNCHNTSSKIFSQVLFKLCCKYTIGLSATPNRSDGCEYVFTWHLGDIVFKSKTGEQRDGLPPIIRLLKIDSKDYKEISIDNKYTGKSQIIFSSMLTDLVSMKKRNLLIIELIKETMKDLNRNVLVMSDRRNHVLILKELLDNQLVDFTYGVFMGSMKESDLNQTTQCRLIIATYKAFSEGISIEKLNTMILLSPKKFVHSESNSIKKDSNFMSQAVGRIFRRSHNVVNPLIIDLFDNFSVYKAQSKSRKVFYKENFKNGIFEDENINLDNILNENYIESIKTKTKKTIELAPLNSMLDYCIIED